MADNGVNERDAIREYLRQWGRGWWPWANGLPMDGLELSQLWGTGYGDFELSVRYFNNGTLGQPTSNLAAMSSYLTSWLNAGQNRYLVVEHPWPDTVAHWLDSPLRMSGHDGAMFFILGDELVSERQISHAVLNTDSQEFRAVLGESRWDPDQQLWVSRLLQDVASDPYGYVASVFDGEGFALFTFPKHSGEFPDLASRR